MRKPDFSRFLAAKYLLLALMPLAVLTGPAVSNFYILARGDKILLQTEPLDPRDFLRGDYVTLAYLIDDVDASKVPPELQKKFRNTYEYSDAYALLRDRGDGVFEVLRISEETPSDGLYLKCGIRRRADDFACDYNLGVYYIPEGTGRALEEAIRDGDVRADIRVLRGRGVIKKLEVVQ